MLQEIMNVEQIMDENVGMDLTEENVETVLDEIRPYLIGVPCLLCTALQCQPTLNLPGVMTQASLAYRALGQLRSRRTATAATELKQH